ncbi:MAG: hypothetical protein AAB255_00300 [Bacteroidota bacterium]
MRIIFLFLFSISLFSQEDVKTFLTKDGNKIVGAVKVETDSTITLITSFGEIKVNKKDIKFTRFKFIISLLGRKINWK